MRQAALQLCVYSFVRWHVSSLLLYKRQAEPVNTCNLRLGNLPASAKAVPNSQGQTATLPPAGQGRLGTRQVEPQADLPGRHAMPAALSLPARPGMPAEP